MYKKRELMKLTFSEGQFFLEELPYTELDNRSVHKVVPESWIYVNPNLFYTTNIVAAAKFQEFSDEKCKRVFRRAFNSEYESPILPPHLSKWLDLHQIEGIKWVLSRRRSYLAHAPGAGKTAQAIIASHLSLGSGQVLFIVPPSLTMNWSREFAKFTNLLFGSFDSSSIAIVPMTLKKHEMNWNADYIVCPDSMLWTDWVFMKLRDIKHNFKFIAVDEASRLKEPTSNRSIAFYGGLLKGKRHNGLYQATRHVVFLDGSPMPNRPMELWAPTYSLDPEAIDGMDQRDFGFRYCGAHQNERGQWEFRGSTRELELHNKLQVRFMHIVKEESLNHSERHRSILFMNEDVRSSEHKTWEKKHLKSVPMDDDGQGELARFRKELGLRKVPFIGKYVSERLKEKNESILLFVWHREVALYLETYLQNFKPGLVIGGVANAEREKIFEEFQTGSRRIIIGNIQAMGRGNNLQKADRIVFGEFAWSDETNRQAEKRASRRGRDADRPVRCEYICCPDSIDEKVLNSVFIKERRVKRVIG